jgi:adenine phosphoribosyltransferase
MASSSSTASSASSTARDPQIEMVRAHLPLIHDYPRPGVNTFALEELTAHPAAFRAAIDLLARRYTGGGASSSPSTPSSSTPGGPITHVVSSEARGFLVGAPLAYALGCAFVPVRRRQKLPFDDVLSVKVRSQTTFGEGQTLEMQQGAIGKGAKVLVVDDVIGTGVTVEAVVKLVAESGGDVHEVACLAAMPGLGGEEFLLSTGLKVFTLL